MKKLLAIILLGLSTSALAGFNDNSSHLQQIELNQITTIKQAMSARDDAKVAITGYIIERIKNKDDEFIFRDESGKTIQIEIDNDVWNGLNISPQDKITIYGEVDKDFTKTTIDVKKIEKY